MESKQSATLVAGVDGRVLTEAKRIELVDPGEIGTLRGTRPIRFWNWGGSGSR